LAGDLPVKVTMLRSGVPPMQTSLRFSNDASGLATRKDLEALATKEDLKAFATKEDLRNAIAEVRSEIADKFDEAKRFALVLHEDLKGDIRLLAEHLSDVMNRMKPRDPS
jgi:hypothetical protein